MIAWAIGAATLLGLALLVFAIFRIVSKRRGGWPILALAVALIVVPPASYVVYVLVILVCTGKSGTWIC